MAFLDDFKLYLNRCSSDNNAFLVELCNRIVPFWFFKNFAFFFPTEISVDEPTFCGAQKSAENEGAAAAAPQPPRLTNCENSCELFRKSSTKKENAGRREWRLPRQPPRQAPQSPVHDLRKGKTKIWKSQKKTQNFSRDNFKR